MDSELPTWIWKHSKKLVSDVEIYSAIINNVLLSVSIVHENRLHILYAIQDSNIQMNECTFPVFTVKM